MSCIAMYMYMYAIFVQGHEILSQVSEMSDGEEEGESEGEADEEMEEGEDSRSVTNSTSTDRKSRALSSECVVTKKQYNAIIVNVDFVLDEDIDSDSTTSQRHNII